MGQGIDNHLLALRELAAEMGRPIPEIYSDYSYKTAIHFTLSTSQVRFTVKIQCLISIQSQWVLFTVFFYLSKNIINILDAPKIINVRISVNYMNYCVVLFL